MELYMCSFFTTDESWTVDSSMKRFIEVDCCLCDNLANRHFALCLTIVNVEVVLSQQNGRQSFELFIAVEDIGNEIE